MCIYVYNITFRGKAGWDSRLSTYTGSLEPAADARILGECEVMQRKTEKRMMYVVQCPTCNNQSASHNYKFQCKDLDLKIKCVECRKSSAIKNWKCNCGIAWHTCNIHFCMEKIVLASTSMSQSSRAQKGNGKATSKRLLENATFDQLLDDDLRTQAKRAKQLEMGNTSDSLTDHRGTRNHLRASMLSPKLRDRFSYLLRE